MRKKVLATITLLTCAAFLFGCAKDEPDGGLDSEVIGDEVVDDSAAQGDSKPSGEMLQGAKNEQLNNQDETAGENSSDAGTSENRIIDSIEMEMTMMEKKSQMYKTDLENGDQAQQDMNTKTEEWYKLWDDELNVVWNNIQSTLPEDKFNELQQEQTEWIERKEKNVLAAGIQVYGGSMQPMIENATARDVTRARVYTLAEILAEAKGESYTIPDEIKTEIAEADVSLESVLEAVKGTYRPTEELEINVLPFAESDFTADDFPENTKWVFWYSHSDVLTEADVYAYTNGVLVFQKENIYYVIEKSMEDESTMMLSVGGDLGAMEIVGNLTNQ